MVVCLVRGADLHIAQRIPLPLTVSCSSKIQIGFTFLVLAHPGSPGQRIVKRMCVCVLFLTIGLSLLGYLLPHGNSPTVEGWVRNVQSKCFITFMQLS